MGRLRYSLQQRYKDRDEDIKIHSPRNLETLNLTFRGERVAKVRFPNFHQYEWDVDGCYHYRRSVTWQQLLQSQTLFYQVSWSPRTIHIRY